MTSCDLMNEEKILQELKNMLYSTVEKNTKNIKRVGIAFSGGLDSTLLAKICKDLGKEVTLLTIGFPKASDIEYAKKVSKELNLPLLIKTLNIENLEDDLKELLSILDISTPLELELCLAYLYIFRLASENNIETVLTVSLGIDTTFCGFDAYKKILKERGEEGLQKAMEEKIDTIAEDHERYVKLGKHFGIELICPFYDKEFLDFSLKIPISMKIKGPNDNIRKHIIRKMALDIGVPRIAALRPKKSLQYSARIHQAIEKLAREKGLTKLKAKEMGYKGIIEAYFNLMTKS